MTKPNSSIQEVRGNDRRDRRRKNSYLAFFEFACIAFSISLLVSIPAIFWGSYKLVAGLAIAITLAILSYRYPRKALWAFLIYMPFSGTVTYWLGGGNALFQVAKDIFYLPALLSLQRKTKDEKKSLLFVPRSLEFPLILLLACCTLTFFAENVRLQLGGESGQILLQGILGLKIFVGYVPLIFCAYYLIRDRKELVFFARLHAVLAIVCCLLGVIQYELLIHGICEGTRNAPVRYAFKAMIDAKCFVGGAVGFNPDLSFIRLPGTFVSPWQWGWFLIANTFLTYAAAFGDRSLAIWSPVGLFALCLVFVNAIISGQRIAFILVPLVTLALICVSGRISLRRLLSVGVGLALILGMVTIVKADFIATRIASFVGRWNASPPYEFVIEQFQWAIGRQRGWFGRGLGTGTNATRIFADAALIETYYAKVLYEVGPLGTIAFLGFATAVTITGFKAYRGLRDRSLRGYGASFWALVVFVSYFPYWYPLDTDPVAVYYWFVAGVLLKLPAIEKQEEQRAIAAAPLEDSSPAEIETVPPAGPKLSQFDSQAPSAENQSQESEL